MQALQGRSRVASVATETQALYPGRLCITPAVVAAAATKIAALPLLVVMAAVEEDGGMAQRKQQLELSIKAVAAVAAGR